MAVFVEQEADWRFRLNAGCHEQPACINPAVLVAVPHHMSIEPSNPREPVESSISLPLHSDTTTFPLPSDPSASEITSPHSWTLSVASSNDSPSTARSCYSSETTLDSVRSDSSRRCSTIPSHISSRASSTVASPATVSNTPRSLPRLSPRIPETCPFKDCKSFTSSGSTSSRSALSHHISQQHRYRCEQGCENVGFPNQRDLDRHHTTKNIHSQTNLSGCSYRCGGCNHTNARRDNYLRHLGTCDPVHCASTYVCGLCHYDSGTNKDEHVIHVKQCMKQRGRKKLNSLS